MSTVHIADELQVASEFERVRPVASGCSHQQFSYTTPAGHEYRIWINGYNRNKSWRTALVTIAQEGKAKGLEVFSNHAGHRSLVDALKWLQAFD